MFVARHDADGLIDPADPVSLDHPLCRGMTAWWLAGVPNATRGPYWRELARNIKSGGAVLTNGPTWIGGRAKPGIPAAISFTGTTQRVMAGLTAHLFPTATDCTVLVVRRKRDTTNRQSSAFGVNSSNAGEQVGVHLPWNDNNVYWNFGGVTNNVSRLTVSGLTWDTNWHWWAFTVGGGGGMRCYLDGKLVGSNAATPSRVDAGGLWSPANWGNNVAASDLADHAETVVFDRALRTDEIEEWWQQSRAGHPDTLRRWRPKAYGFFGTQPAYDPSRFPRVPLPQPDRTPAAGVPY